MAARFENKVAIVTGGGRGIGLATAKQFIQEGARVIILDVDTQGEQAAKQIGAEFIQHDVSNEADWDKLALHVRANYGALHAMVNNAGVEHRAALEQMQLADWERILAINLTGPFLGCRFAVRLMQENPDQAFGGIVNVSSISHTLSIPDDIAYTASKGGVLSLSRAVAHHCGRKGLRIRCNALSPGAVRTELAEQFIASAPDPSVVEAALNKLQPVGHMATPADIAQSIVFLCSPDSEFITGADLVADGGASTAVNLG